jgi:hypothetical protein
LVGWDGPGGSSGEQGVDQDPPLAPGEGVAGLGAPLGAARPLVPGPLGIRPQRSQVVVDQLLLHGDVHVVFTSSAVSGASARLGLGGRELGWQRGQRMLAGTSPGTLERNGSAVDEHLPAPHPPGLAALLGALKAPGAQRAGPAELLGQLQLAG